MQRSKKYLFEIAHPKHFYQFRYLIKKLQEQNHVMVIARDKDLVIELVEASRFSYQRYGLHGKHIVSKLIVTPKILLDYLKIARKIQPDLIISKASPYAPLVAPFVHAKTLIMPDDEIVLLTNKFVVPLTDYIITPANFGLAYKGRHHRVSGLFEEAYLHQDHFTPDPKTCELLGIQQNEIYYILRFVGWNANHDVGMHGISAEQKITLAKTLQRTGRVFITSEADLPSELEPFKLRIPADKIHHILYYAHLYAGDSQSMATEAALLGTPSIRYNSFVGQNDMTNFKYLEKNHGLIINENSFQGFLDSIRKLTRSPQASKDSWMKKRKFYFRGKKDINKELLDLIANM